MIDFKEREFVVFLEGLTPVKLISYSEFIGTSPKKNTLPHFADSQRQALYLLVDKNIRIRKIIMFVAHFDRRGEALDTPLSLRDLSRFCRPWIPFGGTTIDCLSANDCHHNSLKSLLWTSPKQELPQWLQSLHKSLKNTLQTAKEENSQYSPNDKHKPPNRINKPVPTKILSPSQESLLIDVLDKEPTAPSNLNLSDSSLREKHAQQTSIQHKIPKSPPLFFNDNELLSPPLHDSTRLLNHNMPEQTQEIIFLKDGHKQAQSQSLKEMYQNKFQQWIKQLKAAKKLIHNLTAERRRFKKKVEEQEKSIVSLKTDLLQKSMMLLQKENQLRNHQKEILELKELQTDTENLLDKESLFTADNLSQRIADYSMILVHIHPILGHISIRANDFVEFVSDPDNFLAKKFNVSKEHYLLWMNHCKKPVCEICTQQQPTKYHTLDIIDSPADFIPGEHDRCEIHRNHVSKASYQ